MRTVELKKSPGIEAIVRHPAFPGTIWNLEPRQSGLLPVAWDRGGPINISWEIHGHGKIKIVLIIGLGGIKSFWQRQTLHFGHNHGDKYSVLLIDNRGMGDSDKPFWVRYTTLEMARDVVEVLDYIGWTSDLQLHVLGHSLGGMIAQELACLIPGRICTLNLISTAARIENTASFSENFQDRVSMLRPRNLEGDIINTIRRVFTDEWLAAPDDADLPTRQTPHCPRPRTLHPPSQEAPPVLANAPLYPHFETNYQRAMAEELLKKTSEARGLGPPTFSKKGFFNQVLAATWHRKTEAQLRALADAVGRERIMVIHGEADRLIACELGERLMRALEPAVALVLEGMGHAPFVEQARPFNELMEQRFAMGEKLNCG